MGPTCHITLSSPISPLPLNLSPSLSTRIAARGSGQEAGLAPRERAALAVSLAWATAEGGGADGGRSNAVSPLPSARLCARDAARPGARRRGLAMDDDDE